MDTFGAAEVFTDDSGELTGARGSYVLHGSTYVDDRNLGVRYRVTDPLAAYFGGADGLVEVNGELVCLDADGDCDGPRASYLEPQGQPTAATHVDLCGTSGVCVQFHSFYNKVVFPPYARHGSNVNFTTYSALPSTSMWTSGWIQTPSGPGFDMLLLPYEETIGEDSVESARWCFGNFECLEYQADRVCGGGEIDDIDVEGYRTTGNGPTGWACPG